MDQASKKIAIFSGIDYWARPVFIQEISPGKQRKYCLVDELFSSWDWKDGKLSENGEAKLAEYIEGINDGTLQLYTLSGDREEPGFPIQGIEVRRGERMKTTLTKASFTA